jgi:3-dehydroquinate synthase
VKSQEKIPETANPLTVSLGTRSYPIHIGAGLLDNAALLTRCLSARKVAIISNAVVAPLYASKILAARAGRETIEIVLPDGEVHKTLESISRIIDVLVANRFSRDDLLVALGGGVIGDMVGFAAACYQRGIGFVQIPTTLLAQVDSSVGGKTGVNHPGGKNLIGAFHQPRAVIADIASLGSLPTRELRAGLAEVVKYGLICDPSFFAWLESNADALLAVDPATVTAAVRRSCEIKAEIVARDEHEHGDRALLNLGHTFGHAIETVTGYSSWLHGEAVAAGLMMAAVMSRHAGWMSAAECERLRGMLQRLGLRTDAKPEVTAAAARTAMSIDKKVKDGKLRFVLLRGIGKAFVTADYPAAALDATLAEHFA